MKALGEAVARWKAEADTLERYGDTRTAHVVRMLADDALRAARDTADELLTLQEAADESGYSPDHLRHLVADGTLPNAGEKGRPRIRRGDLPMKPGHDLVQAEVEADAEDVLRALRGAA